MHSIFFPFPYVCFKSLFLEGKECFFQHCVNQIVKRGEGLDLGVEKIGDKLRVPMC